MNVETINKEWCEKMIKALSMQNAAVVFCYGMTKDGKTKICMTTDVTPKQVVEHLENIIKILKPQ